MAEPTPEDLRVSRIAAAVMVVLGGALLALGALAGDERYAALAFVLGAPTAAVGALTLAYTRIGPRLPNPRRWRGQREP